MESSEQRPPDNAPHDETVSEPDASPLSSTGDDVGETDSRAAQRPGEGASPRPPRSRRSPPRSGGALVGTIVFVLVAILTIFAIGAGGIGVLLMIFLATSWPLAAPGILLYVIAICLPAALTIWMRKRSGGESGAFQLPGPLLFAAGAAGAIVLGQLFQVGRVSLLVLLTFWLAAALPPLAALALASQRLPNVTTWRRAIFGLVTGSLLSTTSVLLLGGIVTAAAYAVVLPLREIVAHVAASPGAEKLFFSPALAA